MTDILTTNILIALIAAPVLWFGAQFLLTLLVEPYRRKLKSGLDYLLEHAPLERAEADFLQQMWATAFSARSAIMLCLIYIQGLAMRKEAVVREVEAMAESHPAFWADRRMSDMTDWYLLSILAANPLFGLVSLVLRFAWRVKVIVLLRSRADEDHLSALPAVEAACKV